MLKNYREKLTAKHYQQYKEIYPPKKVNMLQNYNVLTFIIIFIKTPVYNPVYNYNHVKDTKVSLPNANKCT